MKTSGPDGLEAWSVALSACFINFVMAGIGRMSGVLYVAFIDIFEVDRRQASVPFSVRSLTRNLLGPVVGILGQKYGVRAASVAGGIIGTICTAFCFYAHDMLLITIIWGGIGGIGAALTTTLNQVILSQHFKKYRTTASGMSVSGGCVGSMLFPALFEFLLHTYGLGGTFLLLAGVTMNVIPAAMLLRKPSWLNTKSQRKLEISTINQASDGRQKQSSSGEKCQGTAKKISPKHGQVNIAYRNDENDIRRGLSFRSDTDHNFTSDFRIDAEFLRRNNKLITFLLTTNFEDRQNQHKGYSCLSTSNLMKELEDLYDAVESSLSYSDSSKQTDKSVKYPDFYFENSFRKLQTLDEKREVIRKLNLRTKAETKEIILLLFKKLLNEDMKNIVALFPEDEHRSISKIVEQLRFIYELFLEKEISCALPSDVVKQNISQICNQKSGTDTQVSHSNTFSTHIRTALRLHTNPIFLLISLCRSVHFISFVPAVTIIVDFSRDKGLLEEDGKYVIAALSFGDLVGRLCFGWVTDKEYIGLPRYMLVAMVLQGACTASLSIMQSKITLLCAIALFGLLQGTLFVRHPVLASKYLGSHEQSVAMGCFNFFAGLLGIALPSYIGYFRDTIGSYDYIFYINGACSTLIGSLWLFEPFFVRCINRSAKSDSQTAV